MKRSLAGLLIIVAAFPASAATFASKTAGAGDASAAPALPPVLPGWDSCKWNDPTHQTPKYVVGRIVAALPPSPNGLKAAAPAINVYYPGTHVVKDGSDKIDIPCVGVIDMVVNSGGLEDPDQGDSWAWQPVEDKCGACNPNKCEAVSKSKKCAAAAAAAAAAAPKAGGSALAGRPGGGKTASAPSGGTGRPRADRSDVVAQAKEDLLAAGKDLSGPCGAFSIVKLAAWRLRDEGAGLLSKPSGNNCDGYATDIIAYPDGKIYDVLVAAGEANNPSWQDDGTADATRYREPEDPGEP